MIGRRLGMQPLDAPKTDAGSREWSQQQSAMQQPPAAGLTNEVL